MLTLSELRTFVNIKKDKIMKLKKPIPSQQVTLLKKIKVRLDFKTTVIINRLSSLANWKKLYPEARVVH
jgi:hypothetical protein